jgi:eukaryotic-like serine/threonine-protein kinase
MADSQAARPPLVGRYQIASHLSGGSFDDLYKGFDPLLERPVIVRLFPLRARDEAVARMKDVFYAQMQRAGMLSHHGIATLFDAGEWQSALFMASEFIDATNLGDLIASRIGMDLPMRVALHAQIVDALEYAREAGVAHLHLRPTSVLVSGDFSVKIGGFGVAPVVDALIAATSARVPASRYAAPERLRGSAGDHRSDVFSVAAIALDLFAGSRAPGGATPKAPRLPAELAAEGVNPDRWAAVFERALATDPDDRFDSPAEFEVELLLTLGQGAADAPLARDVVRSDTLSATRSLDASILSSQSAMGSDALGDRDTTTRTGGTDTTTQTTAAGDIHTRLAAWPNPEASTATNQPAGPGKP